MDYQLFTRTEKSLERGHTVNQDRFMFSEFSFQGDRKIRLLILADGMGGLDCGEIAAENAVKGFSRSVYTQLIEEYMKPELQRFSMAYCSDRIRTILRKAFDDANTEVCSNAGEMIESGTTLSVVCIVDRYAIIANAGDSPVYFYRGAKKQLSLVSTLQTLAERDVSEGKYQRYSEQYYDHEHIIYSDLGEYDRLSDEDVCFAEVGDLEEGDAFLIGSDGAFGRLYDCEIQQVLEQKRGKEEELLPSLFEMARAGKNDDQTGMLYLVKENIFKF